MRRRGGEEREIENLCMCVCGRECVTLFGIGGNGVVESEVHQLLIQTYDRHA